MCTQQKKTVHLEDLNINLNTENKPQYTPNIPVLFNIALFHGVILL